jgi:hypothetical protein
MREGSQGNILTAAIEKIIITNKSRCLPVIKKLTRMKITLLINGNKNMNRSKNLAIQIRNNPAITQARKRYSVSACMATAPVILCMISHPSESKIRTLTMEAPQERTEIIQIIKW